MFLDTAFAHADVWHVLVEDAATICREIAAQHAGHLLLANAAFLRLIGLLWQTATDAGALDPQRRRPAEVDSRLAHLLVYIAEHCHQPLTLAAQAQVRHLRLCHAHFSTTFRRATGLPPFEYVHRHRLQRAKELLADESLGIAEVAARVGFADPFYFSRALKRTEGLSPRQYRLAKQSPGFPYRRPCAGRAPSATLGSWGEVRILRWGMRRVAS